jgi:hypothetical protein
MVSHLCFLNSLITFNIKRISVLLIKLIRLYVTGRRVITQATKKKGLCNQEKRELFLSTKNTKNKMLPCLENEESIEIEPFVARIWEKVIQKHIPRALEDLESLEFVPIQIRRNMAVEPLFLVRYE